jgi:hypothetical protein
MASLRFAGGRLSLFDRNGLFFLFRRNFKLSNNEEGAGYHDPLAGGEKGSQGIVPL